MERAASAIDKCPPQNIEAEQATLGSMLLEPEARLIGFEIVKAEDFYRNAHQDIFRALQRMTDRNGDVDIITLQEELRVSGKLEQCGGAEYLIALVESVPTAANVEHYAKIVEQKSTLRRLISAGIQIQAIAKEEDLESEKAIERATSVMLNITTKQESGRHSFAESVDAAWKRLESYHSQEGFMGIPFGIPKLDDMILGVKEHGLYLIGGRPSNGKTVLAMDLVINAAEGQKHVGVFSLETTHGALTERAIIKRAKVDSGKFKRMQWSQDPDENTLLHQRAWNSLADATGECYNLEEYITIWDKSTEINGLIRTIRREHMRRPLDLVVIDYLQLIEFSGRAERRDLEVQMMCRALRNCAQDLGFPIVATTQVKRLEQKMSQKPSSDDTKIIRGVYPPTMTDLREGGNQEAEAYAIILLHNPPDDRPLHEQTGPRNCFVIVAKAKDDATGWIPCWFDGATYSFYQQSERDEYGDQPNPWSYQPTGGRP